MGNILTRHILNQINRRRDSNTSNNREEHFTNSNSSIVSSRSWRRLRDRSLALNSTESVQSRQSLRRPLEIYSDEPPIDNSIHPSQRAENTQRMRLRPSTIRNRTNIATEVQVDIPLVSSYQIPISSIALHSLPSLQSNPNIIFDQNFELDGSDNLTITVIINVLNAAASEPPLDLVINSVYQALVARNPSILANRTQLPFFVIIRTPLDSLPDPSEVAVSSIDSSTSNVINLPIEQTSVPSSVSTEQSQATSADYNVFVTNSRLFPNFNESNARTTESYIEDLLRFFIAISATSYEDLIRLEDLIGYGHSLLSIDRVDQNFKPIEFAVLVKQQQENSKEAGCVPEKCPVCLSLFQDEDVVRQLFCNHIFHKECIDTWLTGHRNSCPLCRRAAVDD